MEPLTSTLSILLFVLVFSQGNCNPLSLPKPLSHSVSENVKTGVVTDETDTLQLVTVLFRHGNRTTVGPLELYPKDPYLNYNYFPYGYGQLTNAGKAKELLVGMALRKRYNQFLGKYYYPEILEAVSTDLDRTKMSLQLVLAGLFPPRKEDVLATGINWQPIPYHYVPRERDQVFTGFLCPNYPPLYKKYVASAKVQKKIKAYKSTFSYIRNHTGLDIKTIQDIYHLHFGLKSEEEYGLPLPEWTQQVWPETIMKIAAEEYDITMGTADMRRMAIGYFLKKYLNNVQTKIKETNQLPKKIHLYSIHENTLAQLMIALGVFHRRIPNYGSFLILELHKINNVYGVKIFLEDWDGKGTRLLKMPDCDEFCPFDKFEELVKDTLPTPDLCGY